MRLMRQNQNLPSQKQLLGQQDVRDHFFLKHTDRQKLV